MGWHFLAAVVAHAIASSAALDNGLARTPPMGWCSWNNYHRNFNASLFINAADSLSSNGLQDAGYHYVNVDGGWWAGSDTGTLQRNASGFAIVNPEKYPNGIQPVIDHIHSKGLKYGHYTDSGTHACNGDTPMSEGYEKQDVALFVSWGIDMLKLDACARKEDPQVVMNRWDALLNASGHPVLFSNCHNACQTSQWADWCPDASNMWRSSSDIQPRWDKVMYNLDTLVGRGEFGAPGRWNDPDFLEVDIGDFKYTPGMANATSILDENWAHFALWCITSSPLILGMDMSTMSKEIHDIVGNRDAIAINQVYAGNAGDLLTNLTRSYYSASHTGDATAPPEHPHPVLVPCPSESNSDLTWYFNVSFNGTICGDANANTCFNIARCETSIILLPASKSGCADGTNMLFSYSNGQLYTQMQNASARCVEPVSDATDNQLGLSSTCSGRWQYDEKSHRLIYATDTNQLCVSQGSSGSNGPQFWYKPLPNQTAAVALFNRQDAGAVDMTINFHDLPVLQGFTSCTVKNIRDGTQTTVANGEYTANNIAPHAAILVTISC